MKIMIEIPDIDIPKRQDILSVDLCFVDGQVGQCTYPFEVLKQDPIEMLQEIADEIAEQGVDLRDGSEWRNYMNETVIDCLEIIDKHIKQIEGSDDND